MKLGRYSQSPNSFTFLQNSNKLTPRNIHSSANKNPQATAQTLMKLPSLSTMRKSANSFTSTTERNTRNQLNILGQKLQDMQNQVHNARMDSNQTLNHMRFIKQQLLDNKLAKDTQDLKNQITGLKRLVHFTKQSHENRSNQLRENYIRMWNQTQQLRQMVFNLRTKMDKIQDTMGTNH